MPVYAVESGARLIIINMGDTPVGNRTGVLLAEKAGEILTQIMVRVKIKLSRNKVELIIS